MSKVIAQNSIPAWLGAFRLKTLGAISCPILIASAFAVVHGKCSFFLFMLTLTTSLLLQILANLINDYGDFIKGSDTHQRLGPPRAMQMGWLSIRAMERGIIITLMLVILCGLYLVFYAGWFILLVGLMSIVLCAWYTLGKKPLAYLGFAEIVILIVFGPLAAISAYYIQTHAFALDVFFASISPGVLSTALMLTNNLRDIKEDGVNKKRTIAVRYGEKFARVAIVSLLLFALAGPVILLCAFSYSPIVLCSCFAMLMPLRHSYMILREPISKEFNKMLVSIGKSLYLFGILLSIGIIYGAP